MARFRLRLRTFLILNMAGGLLLAAACLVVSGIDASLEAEKTLHAMNWTLQRIEQYVKDHPGRWPRSWDDITPTTGGFSWPDLQRRVQIDFDAKPSELAGQRPEEFRAVRPIGPYYAAYDTGVTSLLQSLREVTRQPGRTK